MTASPEGFPPQDLRSFLELCAGDWLALRSHFDLALAAEAAAADPQADPQAVAAADVAPGTAAASPPQPAAAIADDAAAAATPEPGPGEEQPDWAALLAQASASSEPAPQEESWHSSERGELRVAFLEPHEADQAGGLRITAPDGAVQELQFRGDGTLVLAAAAVAALEAAAEPGRWQLWPDGSLELSLAGPDWRLRERIWFTQPNLRLRSSVEQGAGGEPGRARFSSEIRRISRPAP